MLLALDVCLFVGFMLLAARLVTRPNQAPTLPVEASKPVAVSWATPAPAVRSWGPSHAEERVSRIAIPPCDYEDDESDRSTEGNHEVTYGRF